MVFSVLHSVFRAALLACALTGMVSIANATENQIITLEENAQKWPITSVSINGVQTEALVDRHQVDACALDRLLRVGAENHALQR